MNYISYFLFIYYYIMKKIIRNCNNLDISDLEYNQKKVFDNICNWLSKFKENRKRELEKKVAKKRKKEEYNDTENENKSKMVKLKLENTPNFVLLSGDGMGKSTIIRHVAKHKNYHVHILTNNDIQSLILDPGLIEDTIIDIESGHVSGNKDRKNVILVLDNVQYYTEKTTKTNLKSPLYIFLKENQNRWCFPLIITANRKHTKSINVITPMPKYVEYMNNPSPNFLLKFCENVVLVNNLKIDKTIKLWDIVSLPGCTYFTCMNMLYELSMPKKPDINKYYTIKYRANPGNTLFEMVMKIMTTSSDICSSLDIYNSMSNEDKKQIMPMMVTHIDKFAPYIGKGGEDSRIIMKKVFDKMLLGDKVEELINTYQRRYLHMYYPLISVAVPCTLITNCINIGKFERIKYNMQLSYHSVANTENIRNKNVISVMNLQKLFRKLGPEVCVKIYDIMNIAYYKKNGSCIIKTIYNTPIFKEMDTDFWSNVIRYNKINRHDVDDATKKKKINDMFKKK